MASTRMALSMGDCFGMDRVMNGAAMMQIEKESNDMKPVAWVFVICFLTWAILFAAFISSAQSKELFGPYKADVISVYDGDTFRANIHLFPGLSYNRSIRINGIDTPELRAKCPLEKAKALTAKGSLQALLFEGDVVLAHVHEGKYAGRVVADVFLHDGTNVGGELVSRGLARSYDGKEARASWCP